MVLEDHCVYVKKIIEGIMFLTLHADDILMTGNDMEMIKTTKLWLSSIFEMKYMGKVWYILSIEMTRNRSKKLLGLG